MQSLKLFSQLFLIYMCLLALIPISIIVLVAVIGHKKVKPDNNHYEGNEDEIEELLKCDDINFDNEVNVNLN